MIRVAVVGSQGLPPNYGGFESLVDNLVSFRSPDIDYTVFCGGLDYATRLKSYNGARLRYVPLHANGPQSVLYDVISLILCIGRGYDVILILGVSGCIFLPLLRLFLKKRVIVNIDGIEHSRGKWGGFQRWFLKKSESVAVRNSDVVVADNKGISDYVVKTYGIRPALIAYGGDHSIRNLPQSSVSEVLSRYSLRAGEYSIAVCRIEPENNCHIILDAFSATGNSLIYIGNWDRSEYGRALKQKYSSYPNIHIQDSIYDVDLLYILRSNAKLYIHGHSAGGTNPSLVEAMSLGLPVIAYDVVYNRETTGNKALYFSDAESLARTLDDSDESELVRNAAEMLSIAGSEYRWSVIADKYESCFRG